MPYGNSNQPTSDRSVDLFVDCWEANYRQVLSPGFVSRKAAACWRQFQRRVVTINNVRDRADAGRRAKEALQNGDVDAVLWVADELPRALEICGLSRRALRKVLHFTDFLLVTVASSDADYLVHLGGEVEIDPPFDWITPAIEKLEADTSLLTASPAWARGGDTPQSEAVRIEGPHCIGSSFSDQCFLAAPSRLAAPVYGFRHPMADRYPLSEFGATFEKRINAYMRTHGLFRLTDTRTAYHHHGPYGLHYPRRGLLLRVRLRLALLLERRNP